MRFTSIGYFSAASGSAAIRNSRLVVAGSRDVELRSDRVELLPAVAREPFLEFEQCTFVVGHPPSMVDRGG